MKTVSLSGSVRTNVGKKDAKAVRAQGLVPCVVYGGAEQIHFNADATAFKEIFYTPEICFVELNLDGKIIKALPQDVQYHKVSDEILHVDFLELRDDKAVMMAVPIKVVGSSAGVLKGGKLHKALRKLKVTALPNNMPETIEIDITPLDILDFVKVGDLKADNFTFVDKPNTKVLMVRSTRNVVANAEAEAAAK